MRPKATVMSNRGSPTKPSAVSQTKPGIKIMPKAVSASTTSDKPIAESRRDTSVGMEVNYSNGLERVDRFTPV